MILAAEQIWFAEAKQTWLEKHDRQWSPLVSRMTYWLGNLLSAALPMRFLTSTSQEGQAPGLR
jgi:hypothetical protein